MKTEGRQSRVQISALAFCSCVSWRRKWQPTPVFLPGESQRERNLLGCCLWGCTELGTTEATWQQQLCVYDLSYLTSLNLSYFVCKMLTAVIFSWRNCLMPTGLWSLNTDDCSSCYYKPPLWEIWSSSEKARGKSRSRQKWLMLQMSTSVDTAKHSATPMSPGRESILSEKLI